MVPSCFDGLKTVAPAPEVIVSGGFFQEEIISPLYFPPHPGYGPTFAAERRKKKSNESLGVRRGWISIHWVLVEGHTYNETKETERQLSWQSAIQAF